MDTACELDLGGSLATLPGVKTWVQACGTRIRQNLGGGAIKACVWPYRYGSEVFIACDFWGTGAAEGASPDIEAMTFNVGRHLRLHEHDPAVPDAADALHMIGLLCSEVGARVELGR